jgi:transcriptional regulator with XRE-family HTH domain
MFGSYQPTFILLIQLQTPRFYSCMHKSKHHRKHFCQYHRAMDEWWIQKIEALKRQSGLSDVALAKRLDISPAMLAHVRAGRRSLPLQARMRLLDALGYVITRDLLLRLLPEEVRSAAIATNAALTDAHFAANQTEPNVGLDLPPEWQ